MDAHLRLADLAFPPAAKVYPYGDILSPNGSTLRLPAWPGHASPSITPWHEKCTVCVMAKPTKSSRRHEAPRCFRSSEATGEDGTARKEET